VGPHQRGRAMSPASNYFLGARGRCSSGNEQAVCGPMDGRIACNRDSHAILGSHHANGHNQPGSLRIAPSSRSCPHSTSSGKEVHRASTQRYGRAMLQYPW
jgi:hypothetical protein